jgi:CheY-like chemotaxis protein/anti-anti-sigma regulatory factor
MASAPNTILVIDDEKPTLTMFRLFLSAYGYEVLLAENGQTGLSLVRHHNPQIVFTDLKMPEMDGFEVLKQIKKISPRTEVIVITGHGDMDLVIQALNLDATDFINKPIRRAALDAALKRAAERLNLPSPDSCEVTFDNVESVGIIDIKGTLCRQGREQLAASCRDAVDHDVRGVVFHFKDNAAVNGAGLTELVNCLSWLKSSEIDAAISGLSENFRVIFEMVGVSRFARLYPSLEQAAAAIRSGAAVRY